MNYTKEELDNILNQHSWEYLRDLSNLKTELEHLLEKVNAKIRKIKRRKYV